MRDPVGGREVGSEPLRARHQADRQVGAGALQVQRVEAALRHPVRARDDDLHPLAPRRDRVVRVEPKHVRDLLPELVQRRLRLELRVHALRPSRGSGTGPRSSSSSARSRCAARRRCTGASRGPFAPGRCRRRRLRSSRSASRGRLVRPRAIASAARSTAGCSRACRRPRAPAAPRLTSWSHQKTSTYFAPSLVARARDGARRVLHPEVGGDSEDLTRLQVRAEADQEVGEAVDVGGVVAHRAAHYDSGHGG